METAAGIAVRRSREREALGRILAGARGLGRGRRRSMGRRFSSGQAIARKAGSCTTPRVLRPLTPYRKPTTLFRHLMTLSLTRILLCPPNPTPLFLPQPPNPSTSSLPLDPSPSPPPARCALLSTPTSLAPSPPFSPPPPSPAPPPSPSLSAISIPPAPRRAGRTTSRGGFHSLLGPCRGCVAG